MNKIIAFLSAFCLYAGNSAAQSTPLLPGSEGALGACRADKRKQTSELFGMKVAVVQTISPLKTGGCRFESVAESDLGVNITVCNFTAEQIKEIARAENDEEKEIYEETIPLRMMDEDGNPAEGGQLTVRGTRKEIVWSRFLNDENVCRSEFKEKDSAQDLAAAVAEVKELGFLIGLHTGGYRPKHLAEVLPLVDWIGFDVKAPFEREKYKTAVGGADHLHEAEESLKLLTESGVDFECRTTCDPRILTIEDIYMIAGELKARGVEKYFLQKYRPVESDKTSTDADCERFFLDKELLEHLRACFRVFDVRR